LRCLCDSFEHPVPIPRHVEIAETKHTIALGFEKTRAPRIALLLLVFEVLSTVDFNDELRRMRNEVDDVWTDRRLSSETYAIQPMRPHAIPDDALGIG